MDCRTALLSVAVAVQLFSAVDEVRTLLADEKAVGHLQTLLTNAVSVVSTVLTAACGDRLRRVRRSLDRVEQSVRPVRDADDAADRRSRGRGRRTRAWLAAAVVAFGYLKYGHLTASDDGRVVGENVYTDAAVASLRTVSVAGNYYATAVFVDHVTSARRVLWKLNARIMDATGLSFSTGFTVSSARLAYLDICDGCKTLTRLFQTQLFINIVANIFSVTFMVLLAFNTLMSDGTDTIRITLYFLYDSLLRVLQMYFIIDACHTTIEQANSINITFQKKINDNYQIYFTKRKVQLFILEMLDHKIEFIIYGFICLDFELFVSIMGTIATYLLILVQLGSSSDVLIKEPNVNATKISTTLAVMFSTTTPKYITTAGSHS